MVMFSSEKFSEIYSLYNNFLIKLCVKITNNYHKAEEIVHDIFIKLYNQDHTKYETNNHIRKWLMISCKRLAVERIQRDNKIENFKENDKGEPFELNSIIDLTYRSPLKQLLYEESKKRMLFHFKNVKKRQLEAIKLHYYKDFSYTEIAKKMNTTTKNVAFMIGDARRTIKKQFDNDDKNEKLSKVSLKNKRKKILKSKIVSVIV